MSKGPPDNAGGEERKSADYDVGYGKPPREHRFQPGKSGNPRGRPKRAPSTGETFRKVLKLPVTISEGGRKRKISTEEAVFRQMRRRALEGDPRAIRHYLEAMAHYAPEQLQSISELFAEDERLLRELTSKQLEGGSDEHDPDRA